MITNIIDIYDHYLIGSINNKHTESMQHYIPFVKLGRQYL